MEGYQAVTIGEFEHAVFTEEFDTAIELLIRLCAEIENKVGFATRSTLDAQNPEIIALYTRFAAGISRILLSTHHIDDHHYERLCIYSRNIAALFFVSGFDNAGHLIEHFQLQLQQNCQDPNSLSPAAKQTIKRLLICYSFFCPQDINYSVFLKLVPELSLTPFLGLFSGQALLHEHAFMMREQFFEKAAMLTQVQPSTLPFTLIGALWMLCSYGWRRDKHKFKGYINQLLLNWLAVNKIAHPPALADPRPRPSKPKLLVIIEIMTSTHAMFRCYAKALAPLREKFHLLSLSPDGWLDGPAQELFDDNLTYPPEQWQAHHDHNTVATLIKQIQNTQPDIIYYPSIGMNSMNVMLCNLRLAPIQCATLGHPATTCSAEMDYMLAPEEIYTPAANDLFTEKLCLFPMANFELLPAINIQNITPCINENGNIIKIVISEVSSKLNPVFLQICQSIKAGTDRHIQFHFFPNEVGLPYEVVKKSILQYLPGSYVYSTCPASEYLELLKQGDIALSTFPFGSTNGATDVACLGIPFISLEGDEFHSRYDGYLLKELDMPPWLVCKDSDAYIRAALRLINHDAERIELSKLIASRMREMIDRKLKTNAQQKDFLHLFSGIYEKHERLQASPQRAFSFNELV